MFNDNLLVRARAIVRAALVVLKGVMFPFSQSLVVSCAVNCVLWLLPYDKCKTKCVSMWLVVIVKSC